MRADKCLHYERRNLVPVRQDDNIVASSLESPKVWVFGILNVKVLQVDRVLVWKRLENALEHFPMLVAMDPMLENSWLDFFELKAGVRMESEPVPILSFDN